MALLSPLCNLDIHFHQIIIKEMVEFGDIGIAGNEKKKGIGSVYVILYFTVQSITLHRA